MAYDRLLMLDDEAKKFTAKAAGTISGGFLVKWNSGTDSVGSDSSTYAWNDIAVSACDSTNNVVGIALQTATSGQAVAIAQTGVFILPAGSAAISGGFPITSAGYGNMAVAWDPASSGLTSVIGRAFTEATALTGFAIVRLDL